MAKKQNKIDFSSGMAALTTSRLASTSIDYGNAVFTPLVDYFTNRMAVAEATSANFLSNMPDDFSAEVVPAEVRPLLTDWMMGQKQQMRQLSKQLGKLGHKKTSAEYIALEKQFNVLKNSFTLVNNSLNSLSSYRDKGINAIKQGLAYGQDPAHVNALLEFVGKEGYKRIQFRNDGVYYRDLKGQEYNVNDLIDVKSRSNELHSALVQLNSSAEKLGLQGLDLQIDENGNAIGASAIEIQNGVAALIQDEDFAKDLFLGGLIGDYSGNSKIVDYYIAEQIALGMPGYDGIEVKDGKAVAAGDSYNLKILELAQNPPTGYIQQFILKSMVDQSNSDGYSKYLRKQRITTSNSRASYRANLNKEIVEQLEQGQQIINLPDYGMTLVKVGDGYVQAKASEASMSEKYFMDAGFRITSVEDMIKRFGGEVAKATIEENTEPTGPIPNNPVFTRSENPLEVE